MEPFRLLGASGASLEDIALAREVAPFHLSAFCFLDSLKKFELTLNYTLAPTLSYERDTSLAAQVVNRYSRVRLQARPLPMMEVYGGRRQEEGAHFFAWGPADSVSIELKRINYPIGVFFQSGYFLWPGFIFDTKLEFSNPQEIGGSLNNFGLTSSRWGFFDVYDYESALKLGWRSQFYLELAYKKSTLTEDVTVSSPDLEDINPVTGLYHTNVSNWSALYRHQFPLMALSFLVEGGNSHPVRPDTEYWVYDSSANISGGAKLEWYSGMFNRLVLSAKVGRGNVISEGMKLPGNDGEKRFHYSKSDNFWSHMEARKDWDCDFSNWWRFHISGQYNYYRLSTSSNDESSWETFNYHRFNMEWFSIYWLGLTSRPAELFNGNIVFKTYRCIPNLSIVRKHTFFMLGTPLSWLDINGVSRMESIKRYGNLPSDTSGIMDYALKGQMLFVSPQLQAGWQYGSIHLAGKISYALPLYTNLSTGVSNDGAPVQSKKLKDPDGSFSAFKNGLLAGITIRIGF